MTPAEALDILRRSGPGWTLTIGRSPSTAYTKATLTDGHNFTIEITGSGGPEPEWLYSHPTRLGEAILTLLNQT